MATRRLPFRPADETVPWLVSGLGVAFVAAHLVETVVFSGFRLDAYTRQDVLVGLITVLPFATVVIVGGYWLARSEVRPRRYPRAACWVGGGAVVFVLLTLPLAFGFGYSSLWLAVGWLRLNATIGAACGVVTGIIEARSIQNAVEAGRSEVRAEYLETQRDWLEYINGLLRHEILNTVQVIDGSAEILMQDPDLDESHRERIRTIRERNSDLTKVIEDVRLLIEATNDRNEPEPVDLLDTVRDELDGIRERFGPIESSVEVPPDLGVLADSRLGRVFASLFANAVEHNDSDDVRIDVTAQVRDDDVLVRVADNGPGVPESKRDDLFERQGAHPTEYGLGLYTVRLLVEGYGGRVELEETGPTGSVFAIELPRAPDSWAETRSDTAKSTTGSEQAESNGSDVRTRQGDSDVTVEGSTEN